MTLKPLLIKYSLGEGLENLIPIAHREGKKIFKTNAKIKVVDVIFRPYGAIVVVENPSGGYRGGKAKTK